jgi:4-hydroxy-3-polyprenylbenzoate decarboxylase
MPRLAGPGMVVVKGPVFTDYPRAEQEVALLADHLATSDAVNELALVVIADEPDLAARNFDTFVWITFSRSNPSHDSHGVESLIRHKHWGCRGPLIVDARIKPFHAPPLVPDSDVEKRVDRLGQKGGDLHGII